MKHYFALGSYTEPILFGTGELFQGKGNGITICSFDDGKIEYLREIKVRNPSYLCMNQDRKKMYAVNEMKEFQDKEGGGLTQLSYDEEFAMSVEGEWNVSGKDPCHIAVSQDGSYLAIANFASGSVTTFVLNHEGNVQGETKRLYQHVGKSVNPKRQSGPHAHSCIFLKGTNLLFVPDLGIDKIVVYEGSKGQLQEHGMLSLPAGSGPRYGEFNKNGTGLYVVNEISSSVMVYCKGKDGFVPSQTIRNIPDDFTGSNICSDLHLSPDGTMLFVANRGHDSITSYHVEQNGCLTFLARTSCGGKTPRNFAIDPTGKYLLVCNQDSDKLCVFVIELDGILTLIDSYAIGSPVCLRFFA
jgi:6-phosphogluconolactonase